MDSLPWLNVTTVLPTPNECSECSDFEINKFIPTSPPDDYPTLVHSQSPETPHGRPVYSNIKLGAYTITFKNQRKLPDTIIPRELGILKMLRAISKCVA